MEIKNRAANKQNIDLRITNRNNIFRKTKETFAMSVLSMSEIEKNLRNLLGKYHAESAIVFGSYARGEATPESDLDVIIVGGDHFKPSHVLALAEDLRALIGRDADAFELREVNKDSSFYQSVMNEGVRIA